MKLTALKSLFLSIAILFCSSAIQSDSDWKIPKRKKNFHIFFLMGQSNMSGYATLEAGDTIPVPHIVKLPTLSTDGLHWQPAAHPLHNRLDSDRFGLGLSFAEAYLKSHQGVTVGLVPLAWGGSGIDNLKKGSAVYADFIKKLAYAKAQGTIKGVLWHQGESDTVTEELAKSYEKKLHQLIADIRADVGDPNLPFIVGNLAEFYGTSKEHNQPDRIERIGIVKSVLRNIPAKLPHTGFVESTGCESIDWHNVHFDRKSYILLGKRYFDVYSTLGR